MVQVGFLVGYTECLTTNTVDSIPASGLSSLYNLGTPQLYFL